MWGRQPASVATPGPTQCGLESGARVSSEMERWPADPSLEHPRFPVSRARPVRPAAALTCSEALSHLQVCCPHCLTLLRQKSLATGRGACGAGTSGQAAPLASSVTSGKWLNLPGPRPPARGRREDCVCVTLLARSLAHGGCSQSARPA